MGTMHVRGEGRAQRLPLNTLHHMPGKTALGRVPTAQLGRTKEPANDYEYDAFEAGEFVSNWVSNVGGELTPLLLAYAAGRFPADRYPIFGGKYGPVLRSRAAIFAANTGAELVAGPVANLVRAVLHRSFPGLSHPPEQGLGVQLTPANEMAASLVKTVALGVAKAWLTTAYAPPPPPPPPAPPASGSGGARGGATPLIPGAAPQSATAPHAQAATGPLVLGRDIKAIGKETLLYGVSLVLSKTYDQTVGPIVQRQVNRLMGRDDKPVPKPRPMTPGGIASALAGSFLSSMVVRPVEWPSGGASDAVAGAGGFGSVLGTAMVNGLLATAFDTVYSRSIGPAISDAVNAAAGIKPEEREPATFTGERLLRTVARGSVSGAAYHLADKLSQPLVLQLAQSIGGPLGPFLAMAGSALIGMTAATAADAVVGAKVGSLAGSVYSWITGRPKGEKRQPAPAKPPQEQAAAAQAPPAAQQTAPLAPAPAHAAAASALAEAALARGA